MKPKNKRQKRIVELSLKLSQISEEQSQYGKKKCFISSGFQRKKTNWCHECGHTWRFENKNKKVICPKCGEKLKLLETLSSRYSEKRYYTIFDKVEEYQVLRHFMVSKWCKVGYPACITIDECVQNWISPDGKIENMAKTTFMNYFSDSWNMSSPIELRRESSKYNIYSYYIYPKKKIIPELKRNGFKGWLHDISPYYLLPNLLSQPKIETLMKAKQYKLLARFCNDYSITKIDKYWAAIKICIRNNYIVKDASNWCDYIDLLLHFGKDIRNSHFVCPENLNAVHDKYVEKRRIERERLEVEEKKKRAIENEAAYKEFIERFLGLSLSDGEVIVEPLKSVAEFISEGDDMHHCVFANNYFERDDCLILSAKINGQRIETIQFDLNELQVVQSRGIFNKNTTYHKRIVELVNKNKHVIHDLKHVKLDKAV